MRFVLRSSAIGAKEALNLIYDRRYGLRRYILLLLYLVEKSSSRKKESAIRPAIPPLKVRYTINRYNGNIVKRKRYSNEIGQFLVSSACQQ